MEQVHLEQDGFLVRTMWATAAHVVYSQENGGYPSSIIFYPGVNNSGSIVGASYKATIAVLPATYQSERDDTKDYAFLSLNSNIGNTLGYLGWTTSVSVGNTNGFNWICWRTCV